MRILQIAPPWFTVPPVSYGGIEQIVSLLADGLVAAGHDVTLLAAGGSRTTARLWTSCEAPPSELLGERHIELVHALRGHRRRSEFDVIHDHTASGAALGAMPGGPPVVHTIHGPFTAVTGPFYAAVDDRVELVAISADQAARRPPGVRIAGVVHNAVDVGAHPFTADPDDYLLFVGRATPDKGPELAVEVAQRLGRRLRMAVKVNEADEHAYFRDILEPRTRAYPGTELETCVTPARKRWLLAHARVVLFPIGWPEPFGLVPVEANACGTPVVAFGCGAVPEVVADGVSGFVVPPGDLDGFCSAVVAAEHLDRGRCRGHATAHFHAPRMVADYTAMYARAIGDQ